MILQLRQELAQSPLAAQQAELLSQQDRTKALALQRELRWMGPEGNIHAVLKHWFAPYVVFSQRGSPTNDEHDGVAMVLATSTRHELDPYEGILHT